MLTTIDDKAMRDMLIDVISLEQAYRNSSRFPIQRVRDLVDSYATFLESTRTEEDSE